MTLNALVYLCLFITFTSLTKMLPCFPSRHNVVSLGNLYDSTIIFTGRTAYSDNQTYECYKCDICSLHDSSEISCVQYKGSLSCPEKFFHFSFSF